MKPRRFAYVLACSAMMSVFYVPALFIADIIEMKTDGELPTFAYLGLMAVLYGGALIGNSKLEFAVKWLFSLPLSYLVINYFWKTNYAIRALNWVFPYYGRPSAGSRFAAMFLMFVFTASCGITLFAAFFIKPKDIGKFEIIQLCAGLTAAVIIIIIVIKLEARFPSYEHIMDYYRG